MTIYFNLISTNTLLLIAALIGVTIVYFKQKFSYWASRNVSVFQPSIPFGNATSTILHYENMSETIKSMYKKLKDAGYKYGGFYYMTKPIFIPVDLELIKIILSKEFNHFHDRGLHVDEQSSPLSSTLNALPGERWRRLRAKLTPTFSSGKMKQMFDILQSCGNDLDKVINDLIFFNKPVDIRNYFERFTADVIANCGFGLSPNCLRNPNTEFMLYAKMVLEPNLLQAISNRFIHTFSFLFKILKINAHDNKIDQFFTRIVNETVEYREKNNISRKDYLDLLIKLKTKSSANDDVKWTNAEIIAQAFLFFIAGFDTSSSTMTHTLYELARNPEEQEKVRAEIFEVLKKNGGQFTYESLFELKYLEKTLNESLRLHPPISTITRQCTKEFRIPDTNVVIEKGTHVEIPMWGVQMDPEYFPDPEKFDPERFSDEEKQKRPHSAFLAFGEGPRMCIGTRFGYMQTKVGLVSLLRNYRFTISPKTEMPVTYDPYSVFNHFKQKIWLDGTTL